MPHRRIVPAFGRGASPAARTEDLIITEAEAEVLVYDPQCHHIHRLNETTVTIWRLCNGQRDVPQLAGATRAELGVQVEESTIRLALTQLKAAHLLKEPLSPEDRVALSNRRAFIRRTAVGAVVIPTIISISSPSAADAQSSGTGTCVEKTPCSSNADCCDGRFCLFPGAEGICTY